MKNEILEQLLEALEETCFPTNIDWNKKDLYIKGLADALENNKMKITDVKEYIELKTDSLYLTQKIERLEKEIERKDNLINKFTEEN